ncbi:MAG: transketolase [Clostridia bacterium]|nr:transketolase [Clostridia bacterium]
MQQNEKLALQKKAQEIRYLTMDEIGTLGTGHVGGALSVVDLLTVLYYKVMNVDPSNPKMEGRDRMVMSKGHAGPAVYATLASKGYFDMSWLKTLNKPNTNLPSHCDMNKTPGVDMTAGSLGQGFSCAVGIAKASQIRKDGAYTYAIIGDGESQEGQIWEAASAAVHYGLDHFIGIIDVNGMQIDGYTKDVMSTGDVAARWAGFGFNTIVVEDGNDVEQIYDALMAAKANTGCPSMIVMHTVKGKGVKLAEEAGPANHSMPISAEQKEQILAELQASIDAIVVE